MFWAAPAVTIASVLRALETTLRACFARAQHPPADADGVLGRAYGDHLWASGDQLLVRLLRSRFNRLLELTCSKVCLGTAEFRDLRYQSRDGIELPRRRGPPLAQRYAKCDTRVRHDT